MTPEIEKDLIEIQKHFGADRQRSKLIEELNELLDAYNFGDHKEVLDEKADCLVLLLQEYLTNKELRARVLFKIDRTKQRIKSGYYEKID